MPELFLITRSDEIFANDSGVAHAAHCLTRGDVVFFAGDRQLNDLQWRQADRLQVRFSGHKGYQDQVGDVRVRTRDAVSGPRSGYRADGGAVALMLELLSWHATLPDHAPLSAYRSRGKLMVLKYGHALRAMREVVEKSGRNPDEFALQTAGGANSMG